ncbi:aromatic-ring-hydroxylating dioxygenase subunit beta [Kineobactrum salinum]|uniref:Aromatic-ring-hydroxylating dioxygenase subunit beta n=1 Tax=Kineobactrum salinum TaxID=2708301 RepID=A0A6C0TXH8_9GAMM|nr:aromatic-ring-hydroxylating dioxygenase subunit beta [Kineobactrum salinum]QIB64109.1 aromatic-ring-hydroxylating dioxygenase subunit beta [Kineobactrum salinum]QIB64117.1 aromatic-ring-hydroxylating dioxygenase subunit beta [Kineobactrum salinum]
MEDFQLYLELQDLQNRYITVIDEDRIEEWPDFFTEEAVYEIVPRESERLNLPAGLMHCFGKGMMRDRVVSYRQANVYHPHSYRHFVSGLQILERSPDKIVTRSNYLVVRTLQNLDSEVFQVGCYEDTVVPSEDGWRYASKRAIFENARVKALLVIPV